MTTADIKPQSLTKSRVLAAARTCFAKDGFHGASMKSICKACDMSPGTLYHHFPSKEALIQEIILEDQSRAFARFAEETLGDNIVQKTIDNMIAVLEEDRTQRSLVLEIMAEGMRNPVVAAMLHRKYDAIIELIISHLKISQQQSIIGPDVDLNAASGLLLSLTYGILADTNLSTNTTPEQLRTTLTAMMNGLLNIK
ncbi:TetR/AcrR family transcriptional regulator [Yersinia proxima]|uniref:TetR/AcrR family transcriptional regulator n=1 Tax=Yersinia proxima TaxID=2890316 RepID=A0ABW9EWG8_9GAMM|nr:TetR/AcrR family transcriptional regulator [Yersinia proxima]CNL66117.1 HTH-type transcriptional repressor AcnR [Yersinia intermedia]